MDTVEVWVVWSELPSPVSVQVEVGSTAVWLAVAGMNVIVGEACNVAVGWIPAPPVIARPLPIGGPPPPGMLTEALSLQDAGEQTALVDDTLAVFTREHAVLFTTRASKVNTSAAPCAISPRLCDGSGSTNWKQLPSVSVKVTFRAVPGPLFQT